MQPLSRNQRPSLLTSLMNMSLVLRLPRVMHLCRSSANLPRLPSFLDMLQNPHVLLTVGKVQNPLRLPRKTTSEPSKVVRACGAFAILTLKCASRHNGMHFFDISTSKSGHLNFQKWFERGVFCHSICFCCSFFLRCFIFIMFFFVRPLFLIYFYVCLFFRFFIMIFLLF